VADRRPTLVIISPDPRVSHRANEALRIALGVLAGENEVRIVLVGPAIHLLDEDTDELVDGDDIAKYRASLKKLGIVFHVEGSALPEDPDWNTEGHAVVPATPEDIAGLMSRASRFMVF
jgi:DsrE/DsrF/DsrH-like protein